jgi:hypothetical protein
MVCEFARITQVALIYEYGVVSFFLIEPDFFIVYFFSHIIKKKFQKKSYIIKLYKVHGPIYMFVWLTWFTGLTSLPFLN